MIQLKFTVTEKSLEFNSPPERQDAAVVLETIFEMPVIMNVNGRNLLGPTPETPTVMSVLGFAVEAVDAIRRLHPGGTVHVSIASSGTLHLKEEDGIIRLWTNSAPWHAEAPLDEVVSAFQQFHRDVQRVIETRVPSMRTHPYWDRWFPRTERSGGAPPARHV
ncbi:MAG: hypothetical protein ACOZE5_04970 [Verrucomicrobiota bacterium]